MGFRRSLTILPTVMMGCWARAEMWGMDSVPSPAFHLLSTSSAVSALEAAISLPHRTKWIWDQLHRTEVESTGEMTHKVILLDGRDGVTVDSNDKTSHYGSYNHISVEEWRSGSLQGS